MTEETKTYFLTVEWCNVGKRGVFCAASGASFPKVDEPHTELEMQEILGPFWMILSPQSLEITEEELEEYCQFIPLPEYCNEFGIAVKQPTKEVEDTCQDQQPTI